LRRKIKGWSRNREAEIRKCKHELFIELDVLDALAESQSLSHDELTRRKDLSLKLDRIWMMEEIKAWQRSSDGDIKEGDKNTSHLFAKANHRKRKKSIACLEGDGVEYSDNDGMVKHAVQFYKTLFGKEQRENISLEEDFWDEVDKITVEENELLEAPFSEEEIKKAINDSYASGAPSPDSFLFLFYQRFWHVTKVDFMAMVRGFERGKINIARINYVTIILIPKEDKAMSLKKFKPISLINCSFKIFSNALNNRLETMCDRLLAPNQTAFIRGRYILESVVSAHEIIWPKGFDTKIRL
jgi:hypothetical protein